MGEARKGLGMGEGKVGLGLTKVKLGLVGVGLALPIFIPLIQFGFVYRLWAEHAMKVNRDHCSNSCWDTVFKGGYETGAGTYKHIYFNATIQTWLIWFFTLVSVVSLYEAAKYVASLALNYQLRWRMGLLFLTSVYPHYYSWWCYFNYFNDDYYPQFIHQTIFTITELLCSLMVLQLCDKGIQASPGKLMFVVTVAASHVAVSGWDQFVSNVLLQEGFMHQVLRDIGFMVPDVLHIVLPIQELRRVGREKRVNPAYLIPNGIMVASLIYILAFWTLLILV